MFALVKAFALFVPETVLLGLALGRYLGFLSDVPPCHVSSCALVWFSLLSICRHNSMSSKTRRSNRLELFLKFPFPFPALFVQFIINSGALPCLLSLLTHNHKKSIKKEACWTISNITAGNRAQIQVISFCPSAEKEANCMKKMTPIPC